VHKSLKLTEVRHDFLKLLILFFMVI